MNRVRYMWRGDSAEQATRRALSMAGSDALRMLRTESSRRIRERKRIRVEAINKAISLDFSQSKDLKWQMRVSGQPMPMYAFLGARQTSTGVSVEINVGQRKIIKSAFIAQMKSGHVGIFMRSGKARLPIEELFTTRITDVFRDRDFLPGVMEKAEGVFHSTFRRVLPMELAKVA